MSKILSVLEELALAKEENWRMINTAREACIIPIAGGSRVCWVEELAEQAKAARSARDDAMMESPTQAINQECSPNAETCDFANLQSEIRYLRKAIELRDGVIQRHLPALRDMADQVVSPKENTMSKMVKDFNQFAPDQDLRLTESDKLKIHALPRPIFQEWPGPPDNL